MIDLENLLTVLGLVFCTVGPITIIVGLYLQKELFPPITIVNYLEDIPKKEGLYNAVEVGQFYLVYQNNGVWYKIQTDSNGRIYLNNPRMF